MQPAILFDPALRILKHFSKSWAHCDIPDYSSRIWMILWHHRYTSLGCWLDITITVKAQSVDFWSHQSQDVSMTSMTQWHKFLTTDKKYWWEDLNVRHCLQDQTVRLWDARMLQKPVIELPTLLTANDCQNVVPSVHAEVRSLKYSPDGRFLAMAEPVDVVTIYDRDFSRWLLSGCLINYRALISEARSAHRISRLQGLRAKLRTIKYFCVWKFNAQSDKDEVIDVFP